MHLGDKNLKKFSMNLQTKSTAPLMIIAFKGLGNSIRGKTL